MCHRNHWPRSTDWSPVAELRTGNLRIRVLCTARFAESLCHSIMDTFTMSLTVFSTSSRRFVSATSLTTAIPLHPSDFYAARYTTRYAARAKGIECVLLAAPCRPGNLAEADRGANKRNWPLATIRTGRVIVHKSERCSVNSLLGILCRIPGEISGPPTV